jgi:hypothetical protein
MLGIAPPGGVHLDAHVLEYFERGFLQVVELFVRQEAELVGCRDGFDRRAIARHV